jgi:hypothetical protein
MVSHAANVFVVAVASYCEKVAVLKKRNDVLDAISLGRSEESDNLFFAVHV